MAYERPNHGGVLTASTAGQTIQFRAGDVEKRQFRNFTAEIVKMPDKLAAHIFAPLLSVTALKSLIIEKLQNRLYPPIIGYTPEVKGHGVIYEKAPEKLTDWIWDQMGEIDRMITENPLPKA